MVRECNILCTTIIISDIILTSEAVEHIATYGVDIFFIKIRNIVKNQREHFFIKNM